MRVCFNSINFELPINGTAEAIVRDHAADGAFDQQFGMPSASRACVLRFMPTNVTRKTHVGLLLFFLASESDFFGVDHDDEIARIHMRSEDRFLFTAQKICGFDSDSAKDLIARVNKPPLARNLGGFGREGFHWGPNEEARKGRTLRAPKSSVNLGGHHVVRD